MFSESEMEYINGQRLVRVATASKESQPDVAAAVFEFDGQHFYVGGLDLKKTLKYKNIQTNPKIAIVIDDLESVSPWRPRGIKVHGRGKIVRRKGNLGDKDYIRITPETYWSWGIESPVFQGDKAVIKKKKGNTTSEVVLEHPERR